MGFRDVVQSIPGLTHYYPLATNAQDVIGTQHGSPQGSLSFDGTRAVFDGSSHIDLGDSPDFSVVTKGGLSIVVFLTVTNWKGAGGNGEYVHWAGKGQTGAHEWTFRHYVDGGTGEAVDRQGRTSFYHFNPDGGLGAGSYFQDPEETVERVIVATVDNKTGGTARYPGTITLYKDGVKRDSDLLSGYKIVPANTSAPVRLGTRDLTTGYLVGRMRRVAFYNRVLTPDEVGRIYGARGLVEVDEPTPTEPTPTDPAPTTLKVAAGASTAEVADAHNRLVTHLGLS